MYAEGVPVFYFPYYKRNLGPHANNLNFLPGYRSAYGPYLLTTYTWYLGRFRGRQAACGLPRAARLGRRAGREFCISASGAKRQRNIITRAINVRTTARTACRISAPCRKPASGFIFTWQGDTGDEF